ncbi:MAG: plastocyanin/azurin family copper-binding protein [Actinomycetota bacterium]
MTKSTALSVAVVALLLPACSTSERSGAQSDATAQVEVVNISYQPETLQVAIGTEVTWTNMDEGVRHTVTSGRPGDGGVPGVSEGEPPRPDGIFDGDLPDASESFGFTFDEAGTYDYFCRVHPSMTARVVVD